MIPPIKKTVTVPLSPSHAFELFTKDIFLWWPVESHSLSAGSESKPKDVTVEPFKGGQILETCADGQRRPWATVTTWEPGARLTLDWYVGRDPSEATQVDIRFLPDKAGALVELTHDGFDRLSGGETMAQSYNTGWDTVLGTGFDGFCLKHAA